MIFKQKKVKAWTQHKVNLHFLSTLSLNNTHTSFLTGSNLGGTIITFLWAHVFPLVYLTNITPFDGELTKSTIAPFDGELARSTIAASPSFLADLPLLASFDGELAKSTITAAASPSFLASLPLLSRFDGELAKSTMVALVFFLTGLPLMIALDGELGKSTMEVFSVGIGSWFCSTSSGGWFWMGG